MFFRCLPVVALFRPAPAVIGPADVSHGSSDGERGRSCSPHHQASLQPPGASLSYQRASSPTVISAKTRNRRVCVIQRPTLTTTSFISRPEFQQLPEPNHTLATCPQPLPPNCELPPNRLPRFDTNSIPPRAPTTTFPSRAAAMAFLILVIGDLHIPDRAFDIPAKFKKLLAPGKIAQTLCLGNLTDKATYEYLRTMAPDLKIVKGRMDVEATSLPLTQVVTHGAVRVGFLEGFTLVSSEPDVLLAEANRLDVDVLCWSGGTHRFECFEYMDKFFVNPGSATGAFTTNWALPEKEGGEEEEVVPSFCLMDVSGRCVMTG